MDRSDGEVELLIREILEDEFDRYDIRVHAHGRPGDLERCVWLCKGKERIPVIPMRFSYIQIDKKRPPRLSSSLEEWRSSRSGDLPRMLSRALTEMRKREKAHSRG